MTNRKATGYTVNRTSTAYKEEPIYYPIREKEARRNYRYRRNRDKALQMTLPYVMILTVTCILLVGMAVNYLQVRSSINTTMKEVASMESELISVKDANNALQSQINLYIDEEYVYKVATEELGMVPPSQDQIVEYEKSEREYVRQYEDIPQ